MPLRAPASIALHDRKDAIFVSLRSATAILLGVFAFDALLLNAFLGWPLAATTLLASSAAALIGWLTGRMTSASVQISISTLSCCVFGATLLLLLGGEGRLFFATNDWQIRDVVLADMGNHHWPFDYWLDGQPKMLRAPLGMYLVPALIGGRNQAVRDWALFSHNLLVFTLLLAVGSSLFESKRARLIAAMVFVAFSGWDVVGNGLHQYVTGQARWDHIEPWADGYQYSAHITQIFWAPQHAFAGWAAAVTYMLWRRGFASVGVFAATLPLVALWSPLALFGAVPFALFAGLTVLIARQWVFRDIIVVGVAILIAMPSLAYLGADAQKMDGHPRIPGFPLYLMMMMMEVVPLIMPPLLSRDEHSDRPTLLIATLSLLVMPLWVIGIGADFQMRGAIMPLALVALALGGWAGRIERPHIRLLFVLSLSLGAVTGAVEIARALRYRPAPPPHCTLIQAWTQQSGLVSPHESYFAATGAIPSWLYPHGPAEHIDDRQNRHCWDRPWRTPRS